MNIRITPMSSVTIKREGKAILRLVYLTNGSIGLVALEEGLQANYNSLPVEMPIALKIEHTYGII